MWHHRGSVSLGKVFFGILKRVQRLQRVPTNSGYVTRFEHRTMQFITCELPAQWKQMWDQREPVLILQAFGDFCTHFHVPPPRLGRKKQWQSAVLLLKNLHLRSIERNLCRINTDRKQMQWVIPALISKVSINACYVCCFKVEFFCTQDFRNEYAYSAAITACEKSTLPTTVVSTGMVDVDGQAKSQASVREVRWEMEHCSGLIGRTTTTRGRVTKLQNGLVE